MKFIPKIRSKEKNQKFVVLEIGLGRVNIAIFEQTLQGLKFIGVGRRSFGAADSILDATLEATDALGAIVDELPHAAIVGICGGALSAGTTLAKYERENPKDEISQKELSGILEKVASQETSDQKLFFSTITGAKIDEAKVTNPLGVKGARCEVGCFVAYKPSEELAVYDRVIEELELKPVKIIPSAFAVTQKFKEQINSSSLLLRVGKNKTEAAQIHESHLVKVSNFDIGAEELEFFNFALEALLEAQDSKELSQEIWLYADSDDIALEEVKRKVLEADWKKRLKIDKHPKVTLAEGEDNFGPSDVGLLALSTQEVPE